MALATILAGTAGPAVAAPPQTPRVAFAAEPAHAVIEPGTVIASYERLRGQLDDLARTLLQPDWAVDLVTSVVDVTGGSREWLVHTLAPMVPAPPDLTCLTAFPVPEHTTSGYGWRDDPINHRNQFHAGADIHASRGTPVLAAGDGAVVFAGRQHGYGNIIYVDHGHGLITRYAHLSKILVQKGEAVVAAEEIGKVGATGRATGPHLHFEVRIDGRPVAPELAMQVAALERTAPDTARLVGLALAPDVQSHWINEQDPPRGSGERRTHKPTGSRPERRGRTPRSHDNS